MNLLDEAQEGARIAWEAIRANKLRSILTTVGIVIGIFTVSVMATALEELDRTFHDAISFLGTDVLYVDQREWFIESENRYQAMHDDTVLPQGIIHGDLFHDNVLWDDDGHGGVIDFDFACDDVLLYDVAIAVNDWCVNPDATLDRERTEAFLDGYHQRRPLEPLETQMWPAMLRRAALRTWLGRLGYNHFPRDSHMTIDKDHEFSRRLLEHHIGNAHPR